MNYQEEAQDEMWAGVRHPEPEYGEDAIRRSDQARADREADLHARYEKWLEAEAEAAATQARLVDEAEADRMAARQGYNPNR